jgi:hypothetical protein
MMSLLTQIPAVTEKLGEGLSGIAVNYRHSPIVEEQGAGMPGPAAGDRAPDAPLVAAKDGASLRLYNLFAEHRHVLLLLGDSPEAVPPTLLRFPELVSAAYRPRRSGRTALWVVAGCISDTPRRLCRFSLRWAHGLHKPAPLPRQDLFVGPLRLSGRLTAGAGRRRRGSVGLLGYRRSPLRHRRAGDDVEISLGHGVDLRLRGRSTFDDVRVTRS